MFLYRREDVSLIDIIGCECAVFKVAFEQDLTEFTVRTRGV